MVSELEVEILHHTGQFSKLEVRRITVRGHIEAFEIGGSDYVTVAVSLHHCIFFDLNQ